MHGGRETEDRSATKRLDSTGFLSSIAQHVDRCTGRICKMIWKNQSRYSMMLFECLGCLPVANAHNGLAMACHYFFGDIPRYVIHAIWVIVPAL